MTSQDAVRGVFVQDFIAAVKKEIGARGLSLSEVARQAECGRPYLHRVLAGEQAPTLEWAEKIASVLGLKLKFEKIRG